MTGKTRIMLGLLLVFILGTISGCGIPDLPGPIGIPGF